MMTRCLRRVALHGLCFGQRCGSRTGGSSARQQPTTAPVDRVYGVQLTTDDGYHTAPAAAETADGTVHVAWVQYVEGRATRSSVPQPDSRGRQDAGASRRCTSSRQARAVHPPGARGAAAMSCRASGPQPPEANRVGIWFSHFTDGKWSQAARLLPDESAAASEPRDRRRADGKVAVVYQFTTARTTTSTSSAGPPAVEPMPSRSATARATTGTPSPRSTRRATAARRLTARSPTATTT